LNSYNKGIFFAIVSAIGFSVMPFFALQVYKYNVSTFTLLFIRFSVSGFILLIYSKFKLKNISVKRIDYLSFFFLGGVLYTAQAILHFKSIKYINPSIAILLLFTYPIFVCIMSSFVRKTLPRLKMISAIIIALFGLCLVLCTDFYSVNLIGVVLSVGAAVIYSIYTLVGDLSVKNHPPLITCSYVTLFASLSMFFIGFSQNQLNFNIESQAWIYLLGIIFISTIVSDLAFFYALELIGPIKSSSIGMIEPIFTAIFSFYIYGDKLIYGQYFGMLLTIIGCLSVVIVKDKKKDVNVHEYN